MTQEVTPTVRAIPLYRSRSLFCTIGFGAVKHCQVEELAGEMTQCRQYGTISVYLLAEINLFLKVLTKRRRKDLDFLLSGLILDHPLSRCFWNGDEIIPGSHPVSAGSASDVN
jgi:hypothetical protein